MAIYRCEVNVGRKGYAAAHYAYEARQGKYQEREGRNGTIYGDLEHVHSGNMPTWAAHDPERFWKAADQYERANGATYREYLLTLPRELSPAQRLALCQDFITREIGTRHAYTLAIHNPAAGDGGEQPHAVVMYSERTLDGLQRDPEQYFRRYNAKHPEKGGCQKDSAGTAERLEATRERWATIQNEHLARAGRTERVSHLSLKAQGVVREPEGKIDFRDPVALADLMQQRADAAAAAVASMLAEEREARRRAWREHLDKRRADWGQAVGVQPRATLVTRGKGGIWIHRWPSGKAKGLAAVMDYGDRLKPAGDPQKISDAKIRFMAEIAKERWPSVTITGPDEFKQRAAVALLAQGVGVDNSELQDFVQILRAEKAEQTRQAKAKLDPPGFASPRHVEDPEPRTSTQTKVQKREPAQTPRQFLEDEILRWLVLAIQEQERVSGRKVTPLHRDAIEAEIRNALEGTKPSSPPLPAPTPSAAELDATPNANGLTQADLRRVEDHRLVRAHNKTLFRPMTQGEARAFLREYHARQAAFVLPPFINPAAGGPAPTEAGPLAASAHGPNAVAALSALDIQALQAEYLQREKEEAALVPAAAALKIEPFDMREAEKVAEAVAREGVSASAQARGMAAALAAEPWGSASVPGWDGYRNRTAAELQAHRKTRRPFLFHEEWDKTSKALEEELHRWQQWVEWRDTRFADLKEKEMAATKARFADVYQRTRPEQQEMEWRLEAVRARKAEIAQTLQDAGHSTWAVPKAKARRTKSRTSSGEPKPKPPDRGR